MFGFDFVPAFLVFSYVVQDLSLKRKRSQNFFISTREEEDE